MPLVNGVFKRLFSWSGEAAAGKPISATEFDQDGIDVAQALSITMERDGSSVATADLPMGNHDLIGMRQAAAAGEAVEYAQWRAEVGCFNNLLHNPSFAINQRAVSGTVTLAAGAYGHDRWRAGAGGCTYTFAQVGQDTAVTIQAGTLQQVVAGGDIDAVACTLSQAGTAQARVYQGAPTSLPALAAAPFTTPALVAGANTIVEFGVGTVLLPQLEVGAKAHAFARRTLATEWPRCLLYFEAGRIDVQLGTSGGLSAYLPIRFLGMKAAVPTMTRGNTGGVSNAQVQFANVNLFGFQEQIVYTGPIDNQVHYMQDFTTWAASCDL